MWVWSLGQGDPLEEGMATHSSILAWRIPLREEPGGYSSWGHKELDTTEATYHARKYYTIIDWLLFHIRQISKIS